MSNTLKQESRQVNESILGQCWRGLTAKEKEPYNALAFADKERFMSETVAYNSQHRKPMVAIAHQEMTATAPPTTSKQNEELKEGGKGDEEIFNDSEINDNGYC